jgi:hypothetical protein
MTAKELYEKETGNKRPDKPIPFLFWFNKYVAWLENKVVQKHKDSPLNTTKEELDKIFTPEVLKKLNCTVIDVLEKYNRK